VKREPWARQLVLPLEGEGVTVATLAPAYRHGCPSAAQRHRTPEALPSAAQDRAGATIASQEDNGAEIATERPLRSPRPRSNDGPAPPAHGAQPEAE
jgi:hypothetical protein